MRPRIQALIYLWIAILVFAAAKSVIVKLGLIGAHNLIDGRNPISFCNVLFTSNLIAGIALLAIHRKAWNLADLAKVRFSEWMMMVLLTLLFGVLGPSFIFIGLMLADVINVVLITTLDIPLALIFGYFLLGERPTAGTIIGAALALLGVLIVFILHETETLPTEMKMTMINIGDNPLSHLLATFPKSGEVCVGLGVFFSTIAIELGRKFLKRVPEGIYSVFQKIVGACLFFAIVLIMLGWVHFIDIFAPVLWEWMLLYGGVITAGGFYFWHKSLKKVESSDLAIASAFAPVAGVVFAFVILGEIPDMGQVIEGAIILIGILIALSDVLRHEYRPLESFEEDRFSGV